MALRALARGQRVSLPVAGEQYSVVISDKIFLSLRTKEAKVAKERFPLALNALNAFYESLGQPPQALGPVQVRALAGEIYKQAIHDVDDDSAIAEEFQLYRDKLAGVTAQHLDAGASEKIAELEAAIEMPGERALIAWGLKYGDPLISREELLERYFGAMVDDLVAKYQMRVEAGTRAKLLNAAEQLGQDFVEAAERRLTKYDYRDPVGENLPSFTPPPRQPRAQPLQSARRENILTIDALFQRWKEAHAEKRAPSTFRRYGPSIASLQAFWGERDVRLLTQDDIWTWALQRAKEPGISADTVNKNDLVAASSVLGWATKFPSGRLLTSNPAKGVSLEPDKKTEKADKGFGDDEVAAILKAARAARPNPRYPRAAASRRWTSWICAYTGARIQEVCWLKREDIKIKDGIWVIHFAKTKTDVERTIPIHDALVEEGLLVFREKAPEGYLFVGDTAQKPDATRTQQEQRASELAEWTRDQVKLDDDISPNHGWRHTFITRAEEAGIEKRYANAICGHNHKKDVSDRYFSARPKALKVRIDAYPRYNLDATDDRSGQGHG
uniref:Tyrosine-type recombinase/integrase n=1 Tax=Bosea sp. NBC_00436 TaxID=2969620 RepID=A0A9E7ZM20_9HYPH